MSMPTGELATPPGLTLRPGGADFAVYCGHADAVRVSVFDADDSAGRTERTLPLSRHASGWWSAFLPGIKPGQRYGVRADGPWDPIAGHRYDSSALLLDPYARAIDAHGLGVIVADGFDWGEDRHPRNAWADTVIYEAHVRSLTMLHPDIPEPLRGTYAALAHPAIIDYLHRLGVTAIELLPIHAMKSEDRLLARRMRNHWGYNTLGFFAPEPWYAAATDPQGVLDEFKGMVKALHRANIEVILDVVYNHTAEQESVDGRTLSWRGLDNAAYYRLDGRGHDIDVTGCGNTLDVGRDIGRQQVLDSLRYWVQDCHIDGFRFDLAVTLGRGRTNHYDPNHPLLMALRTDPAFAHTKLIAEPWDIGPDGWRTGQFPAPFAEWNDRFRDDVRTFWLTDTARQHAPGPVHGVRELATRLAGSEDLFGAPGRGPLASINFVAAHDGFTTFDLTSYNEKHNEANGEGNRDGSAHNRSWNHGVEGPSDDPSVLRARVASTRNLLATLLLSTGTPMVNAGDEFGRTQDGNNNPYCQDNELTWFDWDLAPWQEELTETFAYLSALRRQYPVLRQHRFFSNREANPDDSPDLGWFDSDGAPMTVAVWNNAEQRTLQVYFNGAFLGHHSVLLVIHGGLDRTTVELPLLPGTVGYRLLWDSAGAVPAGPGPRREPGTAAVSACSIQVFEVDDRD